MSTITTNKSFDTVCDALRDVHDEASLWRLSDELVRIAPQGVQAVEQVVAEAQARGIPTKSVNTLRLYRDVAIRFPQAERVPLVSFSAHREAIAIGDVQEARRILTELAAKHGAEGVTVTTVKQAIGAVTGKTSTAKSAAKPKASSYADVAVDLQNGGKKFVAELDAIEALPGVTLDGLHAGLTTVLAQVEARRAKAARKAQTAAKRNGTPVDPSKSPAARKARATADAAAARKGAPSKAAPKKVGAAKVGDLRDL